MKKLFHLLFIIIFLTSCHKKEVENTAEYFSEINLLLKEYNPEKNKSFIDIKIENLISPIEEQLKISDDGRINYVFLNKKKKEIIIDYNNRKFALIISPSEKINLEINISELLNWSRFKDIKVSGINKITNRLILLNKSYLDSLIKQSTSPFLNDSTTNITGYKNTRVSEMKNQLQDFSNYNANNKIMDSNFIDWGKAQIRYKAGRDLTIFLGNKIYPNPSIDDENPYFTFVDEIGFNSSDKLTYDSYLKYIEGLTGTFNLIGNWSEKYTRKRKKIKSKWPTTYFLKLEILKKLPKGKDRDIMMAYLFKNEQRLEKYTHKKTPTEYHESLKLNTSKRLAEQINREKEINTTAIKLLIENYDFSKKEKIELLKLYEKTDGKVIFHDFWATWCAPCMNELPNYNDFIKIAGEDVVFLMLGVHMDKKEWSKAIDELNLKGDHYLLSPNQLAFYEKYFKVSSFPHHQIINSEGQIVKEQIPRVNPANFEFLVGLIEEHKI